MLWLRSFIFQAAEKHVGKGASFTFEEIFVFLYHLRVESGFSPLSCFSGSGLWFYSAVVSHLLSEVANVSPKLIYYCVSEGNKVSFYFPKR